MKRSGVAIDKKESQRPKMEQDDGDGNDQEGGVQEPQAEDSGRRENIEKEQQQEDDDEEEEKEEGHNGESEGISSAKSNTKAAPSGKASSGPVKVSYPKPKNFAERMMNALERGFASESVWWVGDGKAIALSPTNLKESPYLKSYFKAKDYSAFIRNCNRWGFRRVATYEVPSGVVTYENSLFQRDKPHLCKHMRMDSDVQDVFARHQQTDDLNESETGKAERIIAEVKAMKRDNRSNRRQRNQGGPDPSQPSEVTLPAGITNDTSLAKEYMLHKILQMTEQYLAHPGPLYADDSSMTTTMELVRALGNQHQQKLSDFQLASILQLQSSVHTVAKGSKPPPTATASLRSPEAASKPPPPPVAPAPQVASVPHASLPQGLSLGPDLTQHLLSQARMNSPLEAMLMRNQQANQGRQFLIQQQQHQQQNQAAVDRFLAQQIQQGLLGSQGTLADSSAIATLFGGNAATANLTTEPKPKPQGESASNQETKDDSGQGGGIAESQFTTAQELLSRVMSQRKGPGGT